MCVLCKKVIYRYESDDFLVMAIWGRMAWSLHVGNLNVGFSVWDIVMVVPEGKRNGMDGEVIVGAGGSVIRS